MTKLNKAVAKIQKAIDELDKAILTKDENVLSVSSINQLSKFKESFLTVLRLIQSDNTPPKNERVLGIARVVAEQWPFNFELGSIIIDVEQDHKEI